MATEPPRPTVTVPQPVRVVVADFDMPFGSMVGFMVKWAIAAIPALLILGFFAMVGAFFFAAVFGSF